MYACVCVCFGGGGGGVGLGLGLRNRIDDGFGSGKTACAWAVCGSHITSPSFLSPLSDHQ